MHPDFYCLRIKGVWQPFCLQKAEVALVSYFLEKVWLKIVLSASYHPPVFSVSPSHFTFCSCTEKRCRASCAAEKEWKLRKLCSCGILGHTPSEWCALLRAAPRFSGTYTPTRSSRAGTKRHFFLNPRSRKCLLNLANTTNFFYHTV